MEYHRISFIHNDTEYSFIKAINRNLTGYALMCLSGRSGQLYERKQLERQLHINRYVKGLIT